MGRGRLLTGRTVVQVAFPGSALNGMTAWLLAELGARVIKVEPVDGTDVVRNHPIRQGSESVLHLTFDRHKESVALDLRDDQGQRAFCALAQHADAVIEGFRPGVADRLGIGYHDLSAVNPRITYVAMSGFGGGNRFSQQPAHDLNFQALAGLLSLDWPGPKGPPAVPAADLISVCLAALGAVAGMLRADATGRGAEVGSTVFDGALFSAVLPLAFQLNSPVPVTPERYMLVAASALYGLYECSDGGYVALTAVTPRFWSAFCLAAGFATELDPFDPEAQATLRAALADHLLTAPRDEWIARVEGHEACLYPALSPAEVIEHEAVRGTDRISAVRHPDGSVAEVPAFPLRIAPAAQEASDDQLPTVPRLGQHTRSILSEIGLESEHIEQLFARGAAAEPGTTELPAGPSSAVRATSGDPHSRGVTR